MIKLGLKGKIALKLIVLYICLYNCFIFDNAWWKTTLKFVYVENFV